MHHVLQSPLPLLSTPYALLLQSGWTPLHAAAASGHTPVVAHLLATSGVEPLAKDVVRGGQGAGGGIMLPNPLFLLQNGHTPVDYAKGNGNVAAAALLWADPRVAVALASAAGNAESAPWP